MREKTLINFIIDAAAEELQAGVPVSYIRVPADIFKKEISGAGNHYIAPLGKTIDVSPDYDENEKRIIFYRQDLPSIQYTAVAKYGIIYNDEGEITGIAKQA